MRDYGTLSETLSALRNEGYTLDFNIQEDVVMDHADIQLSPDEFEIDRVYRFEGMTNPDDQSVLYAISSKKTGVKGVLVNGYGISTVGTTDAFIARLSTHTSLAEHSYEH